MGEHKNQGHFFFIQAGGPQLLHRRVRHRIEIADQFVGNGTPGLINGHPRFDSGQNPVLDGLLNLSFICEIESLDFQ